MMIQCGMPYIVKVEGGPNNGTTVTFYDPVLQGYFFQNWSAERDGNPK